MPDSRSWRTQASVVVAVSLDVGLISMSFIEDPPYKPPFRVIYEVPEKWDTTKRSKIISDIRYALAVAKKATEISDSVYIIEENGRYIWEK